MSLYGSPDLSKKYGNIEEYEKQQKKKRINISIQTLALIGLYIMLILNNENKYVITISYIGVLSMVYFVINSVMMVIKLFKKESVNKEVIKLLLCVFTFIICGVLL